MSFSIFAMIWFSYDKSKNNHSLFMGMAFLIIGLIDLCHTLSYSYMPNFITPNSLQKMAVFHSEARLISGILFLASAYIYKDTLPKLINKSVLLIFVIILFFISLIPPFFYLNHLPLLYSDGVGSTALIIRQFISSVLILYASYLYIKRYHSTGERYIIPLIYGFIILIFSDLTYFTYQLPGHLLKLAAYFFMYLALYRSSVELPYEKLAAAEEKLRQAAEEKYRSLVQTANDAIISEDIDGIIVSWNRGAQTIFGYTEKEVLGKSLTILMPERYKEDHRKGFERFRLTGESEYIGKTHEFYGKRKDGTEFPFELSITAWKTEEGIFYTGIIRDITERKQAEERLRLFRNLINKSNDAIFVDDPETGHILDINDKACSNLGYTREELLNMRVFDIEAVLPDYVSWEEHVKEVKRKGYTVLEGRNRRKDGTTFPVEVNVSHIVIGENSYMVAVVRDITERKRTEEALRRAYGELELRVQERTAELAKTNEALKAEIVERKRIESGLHLFRFLIDQFNDALFVADAKTGRLLDVNDRACRNLSYSREELLNMSIMDIDVMVPDYLFWQKRVAEIREKGSVIFERKHRGKDGTLFPVEISIRFIVQDNNEYVVGVARDITERKQTEEAIKKYAKELEESNRMKELFIDIMHHDLVNPLTAAGGYIQLLQEEQVYLKKNAYLEGVEKSLVRAHELIENATMFSKLRSLESIDFEAMDLKEVIERVVENLAPLVSSAGMIIENNIIHTMPVSGNKMIEDVFSNLISNAVKYAPKGRRIIIDCMDTGEFWRIRVIDFGEGISDADKTRIFDRFRRIEKKGVKGSGLGLAIAERIVELHKGRIWVEDNPEGGAVFVVEIPKFLK
jgi:PAS domain S-box-containing protein